MSGIETLHTLDLSLISSNSSIRGNQGIARPCAGASEPSGAFFDKLEHNRRCSVLPELPE